MNETGPAGSFGMRVLAGSYTEAPLDPFEERELLGLRRQSAYAYGLWRDERGTVLTAMRRFSVDGSSVPRGLLLSRSDGGYLRRVSAGSVPSTDADASIDGGALSLGCATVWPSRSATTR